MEVIVKNKIILQNVPLYFKQILMDKLTLKNPAYIEALKRGRWTRNLPECLKFYEETAEGMSLPRGFIIQLLRIATQTETNWKIIDQRCTLPEVEFTFAGKLRDYQEEAVQEVLQHDFGVLNSPTGSGKTTMALAIIAARKQPTLIVVHTKELLHQWVDRASQFLGMTPDEIGIIGSGKQRIREKLTIGIVNSIYPIASEIREHFGFVVVDECHHCPSRTFTEAVSAFDAHFMLGLSATPYRRDGLSKIIYWHLGDQVHAVDRNRLVREGNIMRPEIIIRMTGFESSHDLTAAYPKAISQLTKDDTRNRMIVSDAAKYLQDNDGPVLILSDRKAHCKRLQAMLTDEGIEVELLIGDLSTGKRRERIGKIRTGNVQAIVATGSLVGEGFDLPDLSALFLATPVKYSGRVTQYIGRVLRPSPGKDRPMVYDYVDVQEPVLMAAAKARQRVYQGLAA